MLLNAIAPPLCAACGADARTAEPLCSRCRQDLRWLSEEPVSLGAIETWAPVAYEGSARGVVGALKFRGARRAANAMAAWVAAGAPRRWLGRGTLVPVPLHPQRARRRGYNQAALLACAIGSRTELEVRDCLIRAGARGTQVGRDRAQRLGGIEGAVTVAPGIAAPRRAILVDDVITTGATLGACEAALREAGSEEVIALAFARTPGR
jgi:ComF family protein